MNNEIINKIFSTDKWKKLDMFISTSEASNFLNISTKSIVKLIKQGKIQAVVKKNAKRLYYKILKASLKDYIKRSIDNE